MKVQLNIYTDEILFATPDFTGFVPRRDEQILMQGKPYIVKDVSYVFQGSPLDEACVNLILEPVVAK